LVACPLCGSTVVLKLPSAPRLNLLGSTATAAGPARNNDLVPAEPAKYRDETNALVPAPAPSLDDDAQAAFLRAVRHVLKNTEDVGSRFAEEARRMHYGETEGRNIRGQTSPREAVELMEEGIDVMPLPLPEPGKYTLQ
jgi:hypothetical protein